MSYFVTIFCVLLVPAYSLPSESSLPADEAQNPGFGEGSAGGVSAAQAVSTGGPTSATATVNAVAGGTGSPSGGGTNNNGIQGNSDQGQGFASGTAGASAESPNGGPSEATAGTSVGGTGIGGRILRQKI
ncbi:unnamed protein product [Allacma fusca]|uniref:Uncharacterized protein n=1 Tax=Allacma fusca TaxID=39272 RepID=A0A8J2L1Q6_9HEXA|nr:unnamed protein product [Allacma fusca]